MTVNTDNIQLAVDALRSGAVIAYPTEAVYGMGCDPFNATAVAKIRTLKNRAASKGLILIASDWQQVQHFVDTTRIENIMNDWPGPVTKVFPATKQAPHAVCAQNNSIAIRLTDHPIAKNLCQMFGSAIISTSANTEGQLPAKTQSEVAHYFSSEIEIIIDAPVGNLDSPTQIIDAITGEVYRD